MAKSVTEDLKKLGRLASIPLVPDAGPASRSLAKSRVLAQKKLT